MSEKNLTAIGAVDGQSPVTLTVIPGCAPYRESPTWLRNSRHLLLPVFVLSLMGLDYLPRLAQRTAIAGALLAALALCVWMLWRERAKKGASLRHSDENAPADGSAKGLVCRGHPRDLVHFRRLSDQFSEPHIVAARVGWGNRGQWLAVCLVGIILGGKWLTDASWVSVAIFGGVLCIAEAIREMRPLYYRVAPGSLEIIHYGWFSRGKPRIRTVSGLPRISIQGSA